jgi:hypothetical protein
MDFNAQCREYGEARLALAAKCTAERSWKTDWEPPRLPFPIVWGDCWKAIFEVPVSDFPGDLGFFMDVLGFDVNAIDPGYAMLMSPDQAVTFAIVPATAERPALSGGPLRLEFMGSAIDRLADQLAQRGIDITPLHAPWGDDNPMRTLEFATPSGLPVKIWGFLGTNAGEIEASA